MEWIPIAERLPSEQGEYLVTTYACDDYYYVDVLSFHKGEFYSTDDEWGDMADPDVTAWMPLPEPYRPKDTQTEPKKMTEEEFDTLLAKMIAKQTEPKGEE